MTRILVAILSLLLIAGCSGAASTPGASTAGSSVPAPTTIASVEEAAARVIELNPTLEGIEPADPNVIGACCWWEGSATGDGFTVRFEVGWGDCPAGCIDRHSFTFAVARDGAVTLLTEDGTRIPPGQPGYGVGSGGGPGGSGGGTDGSTGGGGGILPGGTGIAGRVLAGPTCPVERPDDPACADQPLSGVTVVVLTAGGAEAGRTMTDTNGAFAFSLPPGPYTLEPQPVDGMLRGSSTIDVIVGDGILAVDVPYDTGIR